jgi:drug/metabolite transporter (DMT)-like permease
MSMRQTSASYRPRPYVLWSFVCCGITAISFASILIRLADAPSLAIATYRVGLASVMLVPYFSLKLPGSWPKLTPSTAGVTLLSGFFLALHFAFWIRSLQLTSVASSTTLVSTTPLFVALFSHFFLDERLPRQAWIGVFLVLTGSGLVAGNDFQFSSVALFGDLLAVSGALAASGYLLAGRFVRRHLDLTAYTLGAYGGAALLLLTFSALTETPLSGFSERTYLVLILLAIIPQLIGHTTFNWALRFLSPTSVAVLILGESMGATLLAYCFFGEVLSVIKALGLMILGTGILLTAMILPDSETQNAAK